MILFLVLILMLMWLCRGKRCWRWSWSLQTSAMVNTIICFVAIVAKRPLGSNTRSITVRISPFPWLIGTGTSIVSLIVKAATTGKVMVKLWSEIIVRLIV